MPHQRHHLTDGRLSVSRIASSRWPARPHRRPARTCIHDAGGSAQSSGPHATAPRSRTPAPDRDRVGRSDPAKPPSVRLAARGGSTRQVQVRRSHWWGSGSRPRTSRPRRGREGERSGQTRLSACRGTWQTCEQGLWLRSGTRGDGLVGAAPLATASARDFAAKIRRSPRLT